MYAYLGARLCDCPEVIDQVGLGHADTGIAKDEQLVLFVRGDADEEVVAGLENGGICERSISDFVKGVGRV